MYARIAADDDEEALEAKESRIAGKAKRQVPGLPVQVRVRRGQPMMKLGVKRLQGNQRIKRGQPALLGQRLARQRGQRPHATGFFPADYL